MGIPTVMGLVDLPYSKVDGIEMIVDGYRGEVYTNPSECCASSTPKWSRKRNSWPRASMPCANCRA
jgi:signal transduction protein with GAF and PtsI domain